MNDFFQTENFKLLIAGISFVIILIVVFFINKKVFKILSHRAKKTTNKLDDFILELFRIPGLVFVYWVAAKIFTYFFFDNLAFTSVLNHINTILIIAIVTWFLLQLIKLAVYYIQNRLDTSVSDNLTARKNLTLIKVFKNIASTIVIILAFAAALLTFEEARGIGVSLLTSAGVVGLIVGFAAQKSIGMILSGIQLAITQPIRLDDVVVLEGEWGRIEEITLTYVVVKIWDERRLVLPVNYFLEKPFQNWTRTTSSIMGTVFIFVDYSFPVDELRNELPNMLHGNKNWDGKVANIQLTDTKQNYMELRILLSSTDSSKNWDLRVDIREKILKYIQTNFPETFAKIRYKALDELHSQKSVTI